MKLADYIQAPSKAPAYEDSRPTSEEDRMRLRELLYESVSSARIAHMLGKGRDSARRELAASIEQILSKEHFGPIAQKERAKLVEDTLDLVLGLGPIEKMLKDSSITEIMVYWIHMQYPKVRELFFL